MAVLFQVRKPCPTCGKPMTAVPEDPAPARPRYVCLSCEDDLLRNLAARKWAESPLRPPAK